MADYNLGTAKGKIEIDADGATTGFGKANSAQDEFIKKNERASQSLASTGKVMVGMGLGIAAGFGVAINAAATFEERISGIKAVSGATEAELEKIRKKALQLGADTKYSASEAALAMEELVKAGLTVEDVLNGAADATVNLAAAGEIELPRAAEIAANAMSAFNLAAKDLPHVADLIAGAANASAISVEEFAGAMQQSSAVAALAGFSFDDLAVAIAAMGNAGIKGSDAGTSLKTFLSNLQPVTAKQTELFKELGLIMEDGTNAFYDQAGSVKPLAEVAQTLQDALAGMTDQQRQMALETLFGSDAIRAAAIISSEGAAGFNELATAMGKVTAAEVAETRMDNLKGSIEQLKGSVETLMIIIGQPLAESLRVWVDRLTGLINAFAELDEAQRTDIVTILQMASAFLTTLGAFLLIASAAMKLKTAFAAIGLVFGSVGAVAFAIIAVLVAIGAALVILYQRNETFRKAVQGAWEWIRTNVLAIADQVKRAFQGMIEAFNNQGITSDGLVGFFERIGVAARVAFDWITGTLIPALTGFAKLIADTVVPAVQYLASELMERLGSAIGWISDNVVPPLVAFGEMVAAVAEVILGAWDVIFPFVKGVFQAIAVVVGTTLKIIWNIVKFVVDAVVILWKEFGDNIWETIQIAWNFVVEIISAALKIITGIFQVITAILTLDWTKLWEGIKNILQGAWNLIFGIVRAAIAILGQIIEIGIGIIKAVWQIGWEFIHLVIKTAWDIITGLVRGAIAIVWGIIQAGLNLIQSIWNAAWEFVKSILSNAWNAIKLAVQAAIGVVISTLRGLPGQALTALGNLLSLLYQKGKDLIQGLLNGAKAVWTNVVSWLQGLAGTVLTWVAGISNWLYQAGKDLIQGLLNGIKEAAKSIGGAIDDALGGIPGKAAGILGLGSPSKIFLQYGKWIIEGLELGLADTRSLEGQVEALGLMVASPLPAPQLGAGTSGVTQHIEINLNLSGVDNPEDFKKALSDPGVLRNLANAVKAGSRQ